MALEERPVYRSLNEPLTIMGYNLPELVVSYFAFYYGMAFIGITAGIGALVACALILRWAKAKDPRYLHLIFRARRFRPALDAARRSQHPW